MNETEILMKMTDIAALIGKRALLYMSISTARDVEKACAISVWPNGMEHGHEETFFGLTFNAVLKRVIDYAENYEPPRDELAEMRAALQEVSVEISRINAAAGETVFNPAVSELVRQHVGGID